MRLPLIVAVTWALAGCKYGFNGDQKIWDLSSNDGLAFDPAQITLATTGAHLAAIDQLDDNDDPTTGFGAGSASAVDWNADKRLLELSSPSLQGTFVSRVFDAGSAVPWTTLSWISERPSGKPIPSNGSETGYALGNLDTSDLRLLAHMDDNSGIVHDIAGLHDGTTTNILYGLLGRFGTALEFPGDASVSFGNEADLSMTNPFTISVWIKRDSINNEEALVERQQSGTSLNDTGWGLEIQNDNRPSFIYADGHFEYRVTGAALTATGTWQHLVATYTNGDEDLYVDGALVASDTVPVDVVASANPLILGESFTNGFYFDGAMDEVALFARALSSDEVRELYYRGATRVRMQVRSCPDPACAGIPFTGPAGDPNAFYAEGSLDALPVEGLGVLPNRYFQYQAELESDTSEEPRLASVTLGPAHVFAGAAVVGTSSGVIFDAVTGFTDQVATGSEQRVRYQVSNDGETWYYVVAATWTAAADLTQTNTAQEIDAAIGSFDSQLEGGRFYWRAVLQSPDGLSDVNLVQVELSYQP